LLTALLAIVALVGVAQAGQRAGTFSVSPMIGYHLFEGDQNTKDGFTGGLSLGYNITKRWSAELESKYTVTETDVDGVSDEDLSVKSFGMNALYHFNPDGPFVPYLTAGFGGMFFVVDGYEDDEDYTMNWGVGAKYFFSDDAAFRVDARHVIDFHSDKTWDRFNDKENENNVVLTAGLYWQFGGPAPAPLPPADSDGDGISDLRDKCPDTPLGVRVDAVGCPPVARIVPPPPPKPKPEPEPEPAPLAKEIITFNLVFGFDKYQITDEMIPVLEQARAILDEDPRSTFMVMGHTCSIGPADYNQKLSERRAASVKSWLISNGIAADRLEAIGYGENQPKYDNNTRDGRKLNRRVEIQTR
jgi:OOP family OmpA-OmpF porin